MKTPQKSLGQIAHEAASATRRPQTEMWLREHPPVRRMYFRIARAVEREVLRRMQERVIADAKRRHGT